LTSLRANPHVPIPSFSPLEELGWAVSCEFSTYGFRFFSPPPPHPPPPPPVTPPVGFSMVACAPHVLPDSSSFPSIPLGVRGGCKFWVLYATPSPPFGWAYFFFFSPPVYNTMVRWDCAPWPKLVHAGPPKSEVKSPRLLGQEGFVR